MDLCYMFSLENNQWVTQEWVHPLYIPALRIFSSAWRHLGGQGPMLVPVEFLNVSLGAAAIALLFLIAEQASGDSLLAAFGVFLFAFCPGFALGSARSTPYAAASLAVLASLGFMLGPARWGRRRFLLAGVAGGLAASLHLSAIALIPTGLYACRSGMSDGRRRTCAALFIGGFAAVLALAYLAFMRCHGIGSDYFKDHSLAQVFRGVEQVSETSIYSNPYPPSQLTEFARTFWRQSGLGLLPMCLFAALLAAHSGRRLGAASRLALWNAAMFAGFFVLNNAENGFTFAGLLLAPAALASEAVRSSRIRIALVTLGILSIVIGVGRTFAHGTRPDPFFAEARFLRATLGSDGTLLVPGCPAPEIFYFGNLHVLSVGAVAPSSEDPGCPTLVVRAGPGLRSRLAELKRSGARVFFSPGASSWPSDGDLSGWFKGRQVFEPWSRDPAVQGRIVAAVRVGLRTSGAIVSPRGAIYERVE